MDITIHGTDGVPIYRQIVNQVKYLGGLRAAPAGEELPPIRTLALQLKVTPNTIVKAYDELETSGVVHKRRGSGTFVSEGVSNWRSGSGAASSSSASTPCWPKRTS
jgi:GntR family transcriptional regulator